MSFVEEELLGSGHAGGDYGCGGAVGGAEGDFDEVAGALGDVGVDAVDAHLHVFGLVVASADDLVSAGDVVGDPLDGEVVAVVENFDLGVVALRGRDGEDVSVDELVGGIVVAVDGGGSDRRGPRRVGAVRALKSTAPRLTIFALFCGAIWRRTAVICSQKTSALGERPPWTPVSKSKRNVPLRTVLADWATMVATGNRSSVESLPPYSTKMS